MTAAGVKRGASRDDEDEWKWDERVLKLIKNDFFAQIIFPGDKIFKSDAPLHTFFRR